MKAGRTSFAKENRIKVISKILENKQLTRPQLVQETQISTSNIRTIVEQYLRFKVIEEVGFEISSGGRKAKQLGMNIKRNFVLIINNMWDKTTYQVYDAASNIVENGSLNISRFDEKAIFSLVEEMIQKYTHIQVVGICVYGVVKGDIYLTGTTPSNWKEILLGRNIHQHFHLPVIMMNDLRAAAYGASYMYADQFESPQQEKKNLVFLHLSKMGTGAGIITQGELHQGFENIAGETGFMPLKDTYADDLYNNHVLDQDAFCKLTGRYIAILNYIINPELVIIGGDHFEEKMLTEVERYLNELSPLGIYPKLCTNQDYDQLVTIGVYHYTIKKVIEDEFWFQNAGGSLVAHTGNEPIVFL